MSKPDKKYQSIELRKAGMSINDIAKELKVSKSSVSSWVKDVTLTNEQKELLYRNSRKSVHISSGLRLKRRIDFQKEGRKLARDNTSSLFISGCMLYWAEGTKDKNVLSICNSDCELLKLFVRFMTECLGIDPTDISAKCSIHDNSPFIDKANVYWSDILGIPISNFRLPYIVKSKKTRKKNIHEYGICTVYVCNTGLVQKLFGAIKEIAKIDGDRWIS